VDALSSRWIPVGNGKQSHPIQLFEDSLVTVCSLLDNRVGEKVFGIEHSDINFRWIIAVLFLLYINDSSSVGIHSRVDNLTSIDGFQKWFVVVATHEKWKARAKFLGHLAIERNILVRHGEYHIHIICFS
jgi:hypothetical protein